MEWALVLLFIFTGLLLLMATGMPITLAFMLVTGIGVIIFWQGGEGLELFVMSMRTSLQFYALLALPLFILMGNVIYEAGIMPRAIDTIDKWMGRLTGRLALLAVAGGTVFATLSGASIASVAILGSTLVPEMEKRGYKKPMSIGPILGSSGLAMLIPPSGLAILFAALARISVGGVLIAIIVPGFLLAIIYAAYIIIRCRLQPHLAPSYEVTPMPLRVKLIDTAKYILPLGFILFMVLGVIFFGVATPAESAATGAFATFILAAAYRRLTWRMTKSAIARTVNITVMLFIIIASARAFSQILAFTGATKGLTEFAIGLPVPPIVVIILMMVVVLFMGCLMEFTSIMMITIPIFLPIVAVLGFNPIWFAVLFLLNLEMALTTPPLGLNLYVMKGVAPAGTTIGDVIRAAIPFLLLDSLLMALLLAFPRLALWLPGLMMTTQR